MDKELTADTQGTVINVDGVSVQYRVPQERIGTFKEYMIRYIQRQIKHNTFLALDRLEGYPGFYNRTLVNEGFWVYHIDKPGNKENIIKNGTW